MRRQKVRSASEGGRPWPMTGLHTYLSEHGVGDAVQVHGAFVGQVVKDVQGPDRFRSPLLVAEDQVDPLVQLAGHELALQGLEW